MEEKQKLIRRHILKSILWCLCGAIVFSIAGLCIIFSSEAGSLEGMQAVTLLIGLSIAIATCIALFSLIALFASARFVYTDKMLFASVYFLPALFISVFICFIFLRFVPFSDRLMTVPLIPIISYVLLWTVFYLRVRRRMKTSPT